VPATAKVGLTSTTSGARGSPLSETIAWFSSDDEPLGLALSIGMPYFFEKVEMTSP